MPKKPETPLYVRIPSEAGDKLDRAAEALGVHKKDLVAGLVSEYVDPDSKKGLSALGALSQRINNRAAGGFEVGTYSFQPFDPPEVMSPEQAAAFLQIDVKNVIELAEGGKLPGRKLGPVWRFSREAIVTWLSTPEQKR